MTSYEDDSRGGPERRVALVTGAGKGVGRGVAVALGAHGWTVYVTGRGEPGPGSPQAETVRRIEAAGGTAVGLRCDHRDDAQTEAAVEAAVRAHGRLDLLVNNVWAAPDGFGGFDAPFWTRPVDDWEPLVGVGLRAHYAASVFAARHMTARGSGLIVNISSFGARAHLHSVPYGVSKAGLDKMAADMAHEFREAGVGVSAVSLWPGLVRTDGLVETGIEEVAGFRLADAESPEFVGTVIARLADDKELASRRSGHTFVVTELAAEYGVTEPDGRRAVSHREFFGGGPLY
ncbi:SDR family NAD(P)-dependent oxidoreductase [Streptomyces cavernicola]|uniref:SDR family NAD(P)-dependent oxidoreductase n=1 Tax=Streptomyces cavernicola TaxID=3043613 RepID=A0ABT6SBL0_9ACTN|nr:SDR family NAD(P)-dependent oxidoreductase [Streptomyces sp. B-S-A6]MDI3405582.1 SDR family NAD(P)-dependent oxidoreductase [Streptomyces sp. B-S-A6]